MRTFIFAVYLSYFALSLRARCFLRAFHGSIYLTADDLFRFQKLRRKKRSPSTESYGTVSRKRSSIYSERNACTGSTSAVLRAGNRQGISAVAVSKTAAPPRSAGLCAETW